MPTLLRGDHILVNKIGYGPDDIQRGDVIVFRYPMDESVEFVKRVVVPEHSYCLRCAREVAIEYKHSARLRRWMKVYMLIPIAILPVYPIAAADFAVSIPLMMVYMLGIGPALGIIRDPPTCVDCGALIPKKRAP